jgi:glutamate-1-semialdehyde 2,1-aminomutase
VNIPLALTTGATLVVILPLAWRRLALSRAKHRSLTGHSRMALRLARLLPGYAFDEKRFFTADDAPAEVAAARRAGFAQLSQTLKSRHTAGAEITARAKQMLPDLALTAAYRVPFPFSPMVQRNLALPSFARATVDRYIEDLDGNRLFDLTGSYGVNLFGHEFYKSCIDEAVVRARDFGTLLGTLHPCVADVAARLLQLSGQDSVSFHMSGTEAVMQAVRLARHHTRRPRLVRFCGAYHGWWDDVQPGPGNPLPARHTLTLADRSSRALDVLRSRRDIACVLVNPLQALHANSAAPTDSALVDSGRSAAFDREGYTLWLRQLREVCTEAGIVLIIDEVFLGFRLARGGAQEYFGVKADMVTYGKTLGGGLPVGVVCGRANLMRRFREARPADLCFARGTFNSHPYVMSAMQVFLERLESLPVHALYKNLEQRWLHQSQRFNEALTEAGVPVRVAAMSSVWTVLYSVPSRYNWMLQFYLRAQGLALSWVGSGRMIFSLDYTDDELEEVRRRFVAAAVAMQADGWWWHNGTTTNRDIRRRMLREMFGRA